ncbi:hypothetical protein [Shouchella miscanthi]|uniref:Copper resistance protein D domain-containing protein n=1 Tax=Shouchella miscanthi TaxID=2598861 RepID=A0ABU6NMJ7_9BACI|nr:hypothetical protein [Shouchella miscanthi]
MYQIAYIIHIIGVVFWVGSFISLGFVLKSLTNVNIEHALTKTLIKKLQQWVTYGVIPASIFVLLSGLYMIMPFSREGIPFYLSFMEQAGSVTILLTILFVTITSKRLTKKIKELPLKKNKPLQTLTKTYANYLFVSAFLSTVVIIVVGFRIV